MGMMKIARGAVIAASVGIAVPAAAHTTSLGYVPGNVAGSVVFWTGSYEHGGAVANEGTFTLTGVNVVYTAVVNANVAPTGVKPVGLIDGVNNFFWAQGNNGYTFPNSVDPQLFGGVDHWQGISFTGLMPGTYDFTCGTTCGTTQQWASLTAGSVRITLTARDVGGVPESATWAMMLLGFGVVGYVMRRKPSTKVVIA